MTETKFDKGGPLPGWRLVINTTGRPERVLTAGEWKRRHD